MKAILSCLLSISALLFAACESDSTRPETLSVQVEPFLIPCSSFANYSCQVTSVRDSKDPSDGITGPIEGFEFRWSKRCQMTVEKFPVKDPPADASSMRYVMVGNPVCSDVTDWKFEGMFQVSEGRLVGDTLLIDGYDKPIRLLVAADRDGLAALVPGWARLTVEPGEGEWLKGHSVRQQVMDSLSD